MSHVCKRAVRRILTSKNFRSEAALPSFDDHKLAYQNKRTVELLRALFVMKICSIDSFITHSEQLYWWCRSIIGGRLVNIASRPFYSQFVGGNDENEMKLVVKELKKANIRLMLLPQYEEDEGDADTRDDKFGNNFRRLMWLSELVPRLGGSSALLPLKVSGVMPAEILVQLSEECKNNLNRVKLIEETAEVLMNDRPLDFITTMNRSQKKILSRSLHRIGELIKSSWEIQQRILIDAEFISMNAGISLVALALMMAYNKERPFIYNTYQCYLKNADVNARNDLQLCQKQGVCFGAKIVRGAYMIKERNRAKREGLPDPLQPTYDDTGRMYSKVVSLFLSHISKVGDRCNILVATHNEQAIRRTVEGIIENNIDLRDERVLFAQTYGMSDHLTVQLSAAGLPVYKCVPFGSTEESLPYLARRAQETRSVLEGARRDMEFMKKELLMRLSMKNN